MKDFWFIHWFTFRNRDILDSAFNLWTPDSFMWLLKFRILSIITLSSSLSIVFLRTIPLYLKI